MAGKEFWLGTEKYIFLTKIIHTFFYKFTENIARKNNSQSELIHNIGTYLMCKATLDNWLNRILITV